MRLSPVLRESIRNVQKLIKHDLNILEKDVFHVRVKAGNGGAGLARFNGVGGRGGSVFAVPRREMAFADIRKSLAQNATVRASSGSGSTKIKLIGDSAEHTLLSVPVGVEIVSEESGLLLARCEIPHRRYLIAKGGLGGHKENGYKFEPGEELSVSIHCKLRPNVAFLGFPNAGKSTLLKAFVPAKSVKIAPYAFTTTKPQMAFWQAGEGQAEGRKEEEPFTLSLADLPGVIEGASVNRGRGFSFLKHLEYADIICVVVDVTGFQLKNDLNEPFRTALESVGLLNREVEQFSPKLLAKPVLIAVNKRDLCKSEEELSSLLSSLRSREWRDALPAESQSKQLFRVERVVACAAARGDINQVRDALQEMQRLIRPDNRITSY